MTYKNIIIAIPALQEIAKERLPIKQAFKLYNLKQEIDKKLVFFNEQKAKLLDDKSLSDAERNVQFEELLNFEVELSKTEITVGEIDVSCENLERLSTIIDFKFEERDG